MAFPGRMDLHMHTTVSDGTDTPAELLGKVKEAGLLLFSVTDHDAFKGCLNVISELEPGCPAFMTGVEFSCMDSHGDYHILGYGYDPDSPEMKELTKINHDLRVSKLEKRLQLLSEIHGIEFPDYEVEKLRQLENPGKPHLGALMAEYGYAQTKDSAIADCLNDLWVWDETTAPDTVIDCILKSGGIPVLAHPVFADGDEVLDEEEMEKRLLWLMDMGLEGVEGFYSLFSRDQNKMMLALAEKYSLYVTAGSDYHGKLKNISLADTGYKEGEDLPEGMHRFLKDISDRIIRS